MGSDLYAFSTYFIIDILFIPLLLLYNIYLKKLDYLIE